MVDITKDDGGLLELALFAGAGGGILGGKLLGWRTVCAVEWEQSAASVLCARQNDGHLEAFPIWNDIRSFRPQNRDCSGMFDALRRVRHRLVISGGFPCQDISAAGKGAGLDGARSGMWFEMARVIRQIRPRFAFVENSPMLTSRGLDRVLGDLAEVGFDARWGCVAAEDAIWSGGDPAVYHERERIWIVAEDADSTRIQQGRTQQRTKRQRTRAGGEQVAENANSELRRLSIGRRIAVVGAGSSRCGRIQSDGEQSGSIQKNKGPENRNTDCCVKGSFAEVSARRTDAIGVRQESPNTTESGRRTSGDEGDGDDGETLRSRPGESERIRVDACRENADSDTNAIQGKQRECAHQEVRQGQDERQAGSLRDVNDWWITEPGVGRVAHWVANRVDRLKAIGNGQVPAVVRLAWRLLNGIESEE